MGPPKGRVPFSKDWLAAIDRWRDRAAAKYYDDYVAPYLKWGKVDRYVAKYENSNGNRYLSQRFYAKNGKEVTDFEGARDKAWRAPFEPDLYELAQIEFGPTDCRLSKLPLKISKLSEFPCNGTMKSAYDILWNSYALHIQFGTYWNEGVWSLIPKLLYSKLRDIDERLRPENREKSPITREGDFWVAPAFETEDSSYRSLRVPVKGVAGAFKFELSIDTTNYTQVLEFTTPTRFGVANCYYGGETNPISSMDKFMSAGMDDTDY